MPNARTRRRCSATAFAIALTALTACTLGDRGGDAETASGTGVPVGVSPPASAPSRTASATRTERPDHASASGTAQDAVKLVAVGDIASCRDDDADAATAELTKALDPAVVATLGDSVYPFGSAETYRECYGATWGELLDITRPAIGNHDAQEDGGAAYHAYFGDRAGAPGAAWYSYDIGSWHVVVLDANCGLAGCHAGTAQHDWLIEDLAANAARCTLAYWHQARFTSGPHGDDPSLGPFWDALHEARADMVLVGHDHLYERFAPQLPSGTADPQGIRQFIVGTGGYKLYSAVRVAPNSEVLIDDSFGVLELTLRANAYDWRFITLDGTAADSGSDACH